MPHETSLYSKLKPISTPPSPPPRLFRARGHLCFQGRYFHIRRSGGLGPHVKFGGKIWGKIRPSSPNKWKSLGSSVTTRRKSWEKIPILGSNLKFRGQNLGYLLHIFVEAKFGAPTRISKSKRPRQPSMEVPPGVMLKLGFHQIVTYGKL